MLLRLIARCWSDAPAQRPEFDTVAVEIDDILAAMAATSATSSEELVGAAVTQRYALLPFQLIPTHTNVLPRIATESLPAPRR